MAWTPYKSSMGNYPLFGEAVQDTEDMNYDHEFFGYPPSAFLLENTPPFITRDSLYGSLVQCPQPDRPAHIGSGGVELHRLDSSTPNHPSIKFNEPKASVVGSVTEPSAICPHALPSTPSTDGTGQVSNHSPVVKERESRPYQREKSK
jgi:hypothetical protein